MKHGRIHSLIGKRKPPAQAGDFVIGSEDQDYRSNGTVKKFHFNPKIFTAISAFIAVFGVYTIFFSQAAVVPTQITFENGNISACSGGVNTTSGNSSFLTTTAKSYEGSYSAEAKYTGGGQNAYARCVVTTSWNTGEEVWYGGAFFLPTGFAGSMQNQVDLMRWDNFSLNNASQDWGGLIIQNSDKKARLKRFNVSNDFVDLSTPFSFPENRWVWVEMRQKLSPTNGQAINEVWIDGTLQSSSTTANTYGREITRIRYGLVAIGEGSQTNPLNLWVDRATVSTSKVGPTGAPPTCSTLQGDANGDGAVNISDISAILSTYGQTNTTNCADVNKDQAVNISDISLVLSKYGNTSNPPTTSCTGAQHTPGGPDGMGGCWPGPNNTGVPAGTTLTSYTGPCSFRSSNVGPTVTLNAVDATSCGGLEIYDVAVTITNSKVPIINRDNEMNGSVNISNSELVGGDWVDGVLWGNNITATKIKVTGGQHSVHCGSNCTITDSYLTGQVAPSGVDTHNNAFLSNGGSNMVVRHNTLNCSTLVNNVGGGCSAAGLALFPDFAPVSHVTAEKNLFVANHSSASYCTYASGGGSKPYTNDPSNATYIIYKDNIFQKGPNGYCAVHGTVTGFISRSENIWSNNKYNDGTVVNP